MRAGLTIAIVIVMSVLEGPARAQSGMEPVETISIHPRVTTVLYLPDEIEHVRFTAQVAGLIRAATYENKVFIRPHRRTPVGEGFTVTVTTATVQQRFRLRLARHARDARRRVVVSAPESGPAAENPAPAGEAAPGAPAASAPSSAPSSAPAPAEPSAPSLATPVGAAMAALQRPAGPGNATAANDERDAGVDGERDPPATGPPRFALSVQGVVTLAGATELAVAGYEGIHARQPHRAFSLRIAVAPRGAWWAVETNIGWEWLAAPTTHGDNHDESARADIAVSGPLLRADAGMRARLATRCSPTFYAGGGLQAHLRNIEPTTQRRIDVPATQDDTTRDMPFRGVLALGIGLDYRTENLLLGLELHIRQGVPAGYHSVAVLLSVGLALDQGE